MNQELKSIIEKHVDEFAIYEPDGGVVILKTKDFCSILNKDVENWLNRKAIAFGLEGPYRVKWERL